MDFHKISLVLVIMLLLSGSVLAVLPPETGWVARYQGNAGGWDSAEDIALDSAGNVYVTGYAKRTGTNYDFVTIKYSAGGTALWTQPYDYNTSSDFALAMAVDSGSNVIVAGFGYNPDTSYDGLIVKYDSLGNKLWAKRFDGDSTNDQFYDVAVDAAGNIYACGITDDDALIVKFTPDGTIAWDRSYNGPAGDIDSFYKVITDIGGNIYACGDASGILTGSDCLIIKYDSAGNQQWAKQHAGYEDGWDLFVDMTADAAGNVYVTGSVETITDSNYVTIKYDTAGNPIWTSYYTGTSVGWDDAYAVILDKDGNVLVTGRTQGTSSSDVGTVKYNGQTGAPIWNVPYNGTGNASDFGQSITTDYLGNVYVHGRTTQLSSRDYLTLGYNSDGIHQWTKTYDGPAATEDIGTAMAFDNGLIYATGYSKGTDGSYDYATVKYIYNYCTLPSAMPGDLNGDCKVDMGDYLLFADNYISWQNDYPVLSNIADDWLECHLAEQSGCHYTPANLNAPQNPMVPPMAYDDTGLILIWSKPKDYSNVASYNVYQNGSFLGNTTNLFYNVSGLSPNTMYPFTVASVNAAGAELAISTTCYATTANTPDVFYPEDYGAAADGITKDTAAIQAAIEACTPGGKVHLRAGKTFLSGAVFLKSNMTFQVDGTILGSSLAADYPLTSRRFPYYPAGNNFMGLVNAYSNYTTPETFGQPYGAITNVRICGSGVINGCEGYSASNPHQILDHGDTPLGIAQIEAASYDSTRRGDMVTVKGVDNIYVGGWNGTLTLVYPSEHTIFISYCNQVTVADVDCQTFDIHNGDGVNLCTSDTAYIFNSYFDTGDDCINMNAGQGQQGVDENRPVQNVRVFNCTTERGHGGYVIGSFTAAWVQDSLIEDCLFQNNDPHSNGKGIRMKTGNNNGGGARRITCRDIVISGCSEEGIFLDSTYNAGAGYFPAGPGQFSGNVFKNITITSGDESIFINGLSGTPHTNNIFENITGNNSAYLDYCTDSNFVNVNVSSWTVDTGCTGNTSSGSPGCPF
ncbi:MAG: SBBP repeat-containing protein [Sedimentisphaerales bacterium]|nr:SBBP repeat-containing protein [Sedimentisphaerales bacterium]